MVGTHTHTPSADHRILAGGTGFITDVGMTGDYDSVIGMEKDEPLRRFTLRIPSGRFEPALGPATLCAIAAEIGPDGLTRAIAPVRIGGLLSAAEPDFWS
jgi:2',3'-cyclic-nucleotide 2'-phosphodiesterase